MPMLDYDQFCERYAMKKATAYSLVCRRQIPHIRLSGKMVRFDSDEIDGWFRDHHVPVAEQPVVIADREFAAEE